MQIGPNSNNFSMLAYQDEFCEIKPTVNFALIKLFTVKFGIVFQKENKG